MKPFLVSTFSVILLFFWSLGITAQPSLGGLPFVRNFNTLDYNAGIQNWSIAQDPRGIMYIANNFGLLEYDGSRWQTFVVNNGSKMRSVALDTSGKIYVGCQGEFGYFFPNSLGQLEYTSLADSLPAQFRNFDETWNLFLDDGKIYFCTFSNIFIYEKDSITIVQPANPLELSFFVNRELLVHERGRGLTKLYGQQLQLINGGEFFKDIGISSILPFYDNQYLISTFQQGIYQLKSTGEIEPWNEARHQYFKEAIINCMVRLKNGNYAVGTQNFGLFILNENGETLLHLTSGQGLENRTVLSLLEDDLQNLWVGNNNGLAYIELGSPFTVINEEMGLPGTGYSAYLDNTNLYVGTNTGLYVKDANENRQPFHLIEGTRGQVYHIGQYGNDLLMGHHNGAFRIEKNKASLISQEPGSWIFLSLRDVPEKLIGGVYGGIQFYTQKNNHWALSTKPSGFKESSRIMERDREGNLWITHGYKGVFKLALDLPREQIKNISFYGSEKGFPSNILINVYSIRNDLVFTSERGVYKYDKQKDRFILEPLFTSLLGPNAQLWNVREDAMGNIYFVGRDLIGVMRKNSGGGYDLDLNSFNKVKRFLNDDLENMIILKNNEVLFGAKEGFIHYDPDVKVSRKPNIKTHIRRFSTTANGDSVLFHGNYVQLNTVVADQGDEYVITLPYQNNSVGITYAATSFESDGEVMYQYYLEKFDKTWSEWTAQTQKEYTNLHEGKYVFHVRSRNVYGEISKESTYRFVVLPPWYRTAWAYSGYSILILTSLLTGFVLLDRKYKHERRAMELKQKKELTRKDYEMEVLAQKNQEEITRLENEKLEAELRHMNKELGTSTVLILNKNEFISKVKDNLKGIASKSADEAASKELSRIVHDIEGNLSSDADWEHFQVHFDKVHGDFSRRFRATYPTLSPQEMKLSAYLRMNLSTKEIAHLLNISVRGVEISRYRLRKKLQLDRSANLQEYILGF
jgi:ligand-binding sensor domain-containing protein/DNA-binding CsgD family transcriptional regulator